MMFLVTLPTFFPLFSLPPLSDLRSPDGLRKKEAFLHFFWFFLCSSSVLFTHQSLPHSTGVIHFLFGDGFYVDEMVSFFSLFDSFPPSSLFHFLGWWFTVDGFLRSKERKVILFGIDGCSLSCLLFLVCVPPFCVFVTSNYLRVELVPQAIGKLMLPFLLF